MTKKTNTKPPADTDATQDATPASDDTLETQGRDEKNSDTSAEIEAKLASINETLNRVEKLEAELIAKREAEKAEIAAGESAAEQRAIAMNLELDTQKTAWKKRRYSVSSNGLPTLELMASDSAEAIRRAAVCHGCGDNPSKRNFRAAEIQPQKV